MSGAIRVNLADMLPAKRMLDRLSRIQTARLLDILGSEAESQVRRRIRDEKTGPDGVAWAPWSKAYEEQRPNKGGILELGGDLGDSITYEVGNDAVEVGSNLIYALVHNEGFEEMHIPERRYLGISVENLSDLGELVIEFLAREAA